MKKEEVKPDAKVVKCYSTLMMLVIDERYTEGKGPSIDCVNQVCEVDKQF